MDPARHRFLVLAGVALALTACAAETGDEPSATSPASPAATDSGTPPDALAILEGLHPDRGVAPLELGITDLVEGSGAQISAGDQATVHYWGVRWSDGGTFDSSWSRGQPFTFRLGAQQVISGWDLGVEGMRVGGRRVLVIPPGLAYGDRGAGSVIAPGETLVFVVDLVDVGAP
jgi:peptidylprolyl isomerase